MFWTFTLISYKLFMKLLDARGKISSLRPYFKGCKGISRDLTKIKSNNFKAFLGTLDPNNSILRNFQFIKNYKNRFYKNTHSDTPISKNSNNSENNPELNNAFKKISSSYVYKNLEITDDHPFSDDPSLSQPITQGEVETAISNSKNRSAPGPDAIPYKVFENFPPSAYALLTKICNLFLSLGRFPDSWSVFNLCFIPKGANKGSRPIALANCSFKTFERIINDHTEIKIAKLRNLNLGVLSLDLKGAYDLVNLEKVLEILTLIHIPPCILRFIKFLINDRETHGYFNRCKFAEGRTNSSLPHGCILSPLLFNIYIHLLTRIINHEVKTLYFADDIIIYCSDLDNINIANILKENLVRITVWLKSLSLQILIPKSKFIIFNDPSISPSEYSLEINNSTISNSKTWKYLGITCDQNLSWENHINSLADNVRRGVAMLPSFGGFGWGIHPQTIANPKFKKKLDVIQNAVIRKPIGSLMTTSINVLHHISDIPTLHIRRIALIHINTKLGFFLKNHSKNVQNDFVNNSSVKFYNFKKQYTDGSKIPNGECEAEVFFPDNPAQQDFTYKLLSNYTIFSCEAFALWQALLLIGNCPFGDFVIFTDLLSSIKALAHCGLNSNMNLFIFSQKNFIQSLTLKL
ncbi:hypothetical protein TSAR_001659 [Trichomalopsis sarcophagae]|uniref:Reverse transcriptase domain-containing protein n=1 Tax=Trichomalopsis sarcophagae TaxID=543379 RepID=A0A232ENK8_9HYME|nr:hypothetical protein TSAR_001659 [Trichomalopsis sarcophagae]